MLQKITDKWPDLLVQGEYIQRALDEMSEPEQEVLQDEGENIELDFKNLRWTRVIDLRDYKEQSMHIYKMVDDIMYGKQQMAAIKLEGLPQLCAHFDPIKWQEQNKHPHLSVWKLNEEQLKDWGEVATEIRKSVNRKAENYKIHSEPADEDIVDEVKSRR